MLTRLALIAPQGLSQQKLRKHLSKPLAYNVREFVSMEDVQANLALFPFHILIARFPQFQQGHVPLVEKMQSMFPHARLISISPRIETQARMLIKKITRHTLIDEELEMDDLDQVIAKNSQNLNASARMHPRARRSDKVVLVTTDDRYDEDFFHDAQFVDFARMGARITLKPNKDLLLAPKSRVELRYRSSEDLSKVHRLEARVVWIKKQNPLEKILAGSKVTVALRFVAEL